MRKNVFGRNFSRDTNERKALFKSLISSLVINEKIKTTEPKAKAIKRDVEKVITKVKKHGKLAERLLGGLLNSQALEKLINDVAPRFKNRNGGYTRIIKVGRRFGDNAMEVIMEFTEKPSAVALRSPRQLESSSNASTPAKLGARSAKASSGKKLSRAKAPRARKESKKK